MFLKKHKQKIKDLEYIDNLLSDRIFTLSDEINKIKTDKFMETIEINDEFIINKELYDIKKIKVKEINRAKETIAIKDLDNNHITRMTHWDFYRMVD